MSDVTTRFHEHWLGLVQPVDGLVVSVPALNAAECMERQAPAVQGQLIDLCSEDAQGQPTIRDLWALFGELLQLSREAFDFEADLHEDLSLYVPEGGQTIRPTAALRKLEGEDAGTEAEADAVSMDDSTPASRAGQGYEMLLWELPTGLAFDKPETQTGPWEYPPAAKFDRLLRECRVPIGLLCNGHAIRLCYAPHGESSGAMTFRIADMVQVGGRPILDAFCMLLSDHRWFGAAPEKRLPAILRDSRSRQADVTNALADQLFEALTILLQGFEAAAERDGDDLLREALRADDDHLYNGLLTLLLRLVFVLYAEDRGLMPTEHETYGEHLSALALFEQLQGDHGRHPDTMSRRFGAYPRLVALFRAVFYGIRHEDMYMPPRAGVLFDPGVYPFLEGWGGAAPPVQPGDRAVVRVPSVSDEAIYRVLEKLLILGGQRLSYRALEVEQIGSVYEALMGYHVRRVGSASVCLRPTKVWVGTAEVLEHKAGQRAKWLAELGLPKANAKRIDKALKDAKSEEAVREALEDFAVRRIPTAQPGQLVIQPGEERTRTSSHYTPRSLSEPIVKRTLEPLITAMGGEPPSEKLLRLKICDPAMGSGAFLVAACRFLADQVVAAWTREGVLAQQAEAHEDPVMYARRLVAQRCLYGVDKNPFAVNLAKLALWLETLAKNEPFTFVDHALKCGDSLVGLSLDQIKRFEWTPDVTPEAKAKAKKTTPAKKTKAIGTQLGLFEGVLERALLHAHTARKRLLELAEDNADHRELGAEKQRLYEDAELALERARMIGDVLIGAFFAEAKEKARAAELATRRGIVETWLLRGTQAAPPAEVMQWVEESRRQVRPFHWPLEFPEVFWDDRPDPLEEDRMNRAAWVDAFVGNPPFAGKNSVSQTNAPGYLDWLMTHHPDVKGKPNTDLCAYFFRRAAWLLGPHGTLGFVATNTIAQGDSRLMSIHYLVEHGAEIYSARTSFSWPGEAAVSASVVHVAQGTVCRSISRRILDGTQVSWINSRLKPKPERPEPRAIHAGNRKAFLGGKLVGVGLAVDLDEYERLVDHDDKNREILRPYLGGEEVNSSPRQTYNRYMIDFTDKSLEEAARWPDLLRIAEERVRPTRMKDNRGTYKTYWWRPGESAGALYEALSGLERCLVSSAVTKHLCFSFQPTTYFFSQALVVFALDQFPDFVVLQSRVHESWARLLSSSMRNDLRYAASDCFDTFPFPNVSSVLETVGERVYATRAAYMVDTDRGLTKTYNALKDPTCTDPRILELRDLHIEMDRAVLAAYGWSDIEVPPYTDPVTPAEKHARQAFEDEVLDRLFAVNAERAAEEARMGHRRRSKDRE